MLVEYEQVSGTCLSCCKARKPWLCCLHCSHWLRLAMFAQCRHDACACQSRLEFCCLLQVQKGRLGKAIFECVVLAGALLSPLLSGACVFLGKFGRAGACGCRCACANFEAKWHFGTSNPIFFSGLAGATVTGASRPCLGLWSSHVRNVPGTRSGPPRSERS